MPRRGPRSGGEDTRQAILDAARTLFAERGYDRTTIRAVAGQAGVDPALIHHYFGTKEDLFTTSVSLPVSLPAQLPEIIGGSPSPGVDIVRLFFTVWEQPEPRTALLGQLRHAFTTGEPPVIAGFISSTVLTRVAAVMKGERRELRAELIASHLLGVAVMRYVIRMEPLASATIDELVELVAPRVQSYLE